MRKPPRARRSRYIQLQKPTLPTGDNHFSHEIRKNTKDAANDSGGSPAPGPVGSKVRRNAGRISGADGEGGAAAAGAQERTGRAAAAALTSREQRAYLWGYLAAVGDDASALEYRRIRVAARKQAVAVPSEWPRGWRP